MKTIVAPFLAVGLMAAAFAGSAGAATAQDAVFKTDEITIRLAVDDQAEDGTVRGALALDLADGWHTYWRDPGASGIPPMIDFSKTKGLAESDLRFPPPHRFGEGIGRGNGYTDAASLAFELKPQPGKAVGPIDAAVFLGVCREICIPIQAELKATPETGNQPIVDAAFAALPTRDAQLGEISSAIVSGDGGRLTVTAETTDPSKSPDLFVTGPQNWYFEEPGKPRIDGTTVVFEVDITGRPQGVSGDAAPDTIDAVFTDDAGAFEATVPVSQADDDQASRAN